MATQQLPVLLVVYSPPYHLPCPGERKVHGRYVVLESLSQKQDCDSKMTNRRFPKVTKKKMKRLLRQDSQDMHQEVTKNPAFGSTFLVFSRLIQRWFVTSQSWLAVRLLLLHILVTSWLLQTFLSSGRNQEEKIRSPLDVTNNRLKKKNTWRYKLMMYQIPLCFASKRIVQRKVVLKIVIRSNC